MDAARRRHDPARLTRALDEQDQRDILDGALAMLGVQPDQPYVDTPGCTTQACGVRDHRPYDEAADAVVLGVSPDPVDRVKRFHDRHGLGFTLLADADHAVCERYGVWVEKSMYRQDALGRRAVDLRDRGRRQGRARPAQRRAHRARRARAGGAGGRRGVGGPAVPATAGQPGASPAGAPVAGPVIRPSACPPCRPPCGRPPGSRTRTCRA
jgi:peroxiredoxin